MVCFPQTYLNFKYAKYLGQWSDFETVSLTTNIEISLLIPTPLLTKLVDWNNLLKYTDSFLFRSLVIFDCCTLRPSPCLCHIR